MDAQEQTPLGPDDYEALFALSVGPSETKQQADALIGKMTAGEKSGFYTYVNQHHRGSPENRVDGAIASGVPVLGSVAPEDVLGGVALGRGIASRAAGVPGLARKAVSVVADTTPLIKYEFTRTVLEKFGVPAPIAMVTAMAVSGYKRGAPSGVAAAEAAAPAEAAASSPTAAPASARPSQMTSAEIGERVRAAQASGAEPTMRNAAGRPAGKPPIVTPATEAPYEAAIRQAKEARPPRVWAEGETISPAESAAGEIPLPSGRPASPPVASPPVSAGNPAAAHPTRTPGQMSPTAIQSDLGIAARRAGVKLTEPQYQQAEVLVRQGQSIDQALRGVAAPSAPVSAPVAASPLLAEEMSAAETKAYQQMRKAGLSDAVAKQAVMNSRRAAMQMNQDFGLKTPTEEETRFPKGNRGKAPAPKGSGS